MDRVEGADRARGRGRAVGVVATLLIATLSAVLGAPPRPAGAADPLSSTIESVSVNPTLSTTDIYVQVRVTDPNVAPTGVVTLREGGVELARTTLTPYTAGTVDYSWSRVSLDLAPGAHTLTVEYLGSADVLPSSRESTFTVAVAAPPHPVTGTLAVGAITAPLSPQSSFYVGSNDLYDPLSGALRSSDHAYGTVDVAADVPTVGPVTVTVRPQFGGSPMWVDPNGNLIAFPAPLTLRVVRITAGGVTWADACSFPAATVTPTGTVDAIGLAISATTAVPPTPVLPAACGGKGDLVNAVLAGEPVTLALHVAGSFPLPPAPNTPTTTTLVVTPESGLTAPERVQATATVSAPGFQPRGTVTFKENGVSLGSAAVGANGTASLQLALVTAGPRTITAEYGGFAVTIVNTVTRLAPSSASTTVTLADASVGGLPVSGSITVGSNPAALIPPGSRLAGAPFDPVSGEVGSGRMWFPLGEFQVNALGLVPVRFRLVQLEDFTAQVAADGTVAFTPADFRFEAWAYKFGSAWSPLSDCDFGPFELTLTGTAGATGLAVGQSGVALAPLPSTACSGYAGYVNSALSQGTDFVFEVEGDFSLTGSASSSTAVVSWFPTVAVRNQTFVSATVTASAGVPAGVVEFVDDGVVVGSAALNDAGVASAVITLDRAGTRTIVANYAGGGGVAPSSGSTTVEVTPDPDGYVLGGSVTVGGVELDVPEGSRLMPALSGEGWTVDGLAVLGGGLGAVGTEAAAVTGAAASPVRSSGGKLWFNPTQVSLVLPDHGAVTAEVRVVQVGEFGATLINPGGHIDGLSAMYVLHVRQVTTSEGSYSPVGCVNLLLFGFDAQMTLADVVVSSSAGGSGRIPRASCTGAGRAVAEALVGESSAQVRAEF